MMASPLDAHPLPGTSRFLTSERSLCLSPPYEAQQTPPPYPSCISKTALRQPTTRSFPFGAGVTFEWTHSMPPSPDDIILAMVRINPLGRRQSFDDPLPDRPQRRGLLRRLGSRLLNNDSEWKNLRPVKMPRHEYLRHFKRDEQGNYAGTEPEQDWDDALLESCYGRYREVPLNVLRQR